MILDNISDKHIAVPKNKRRIRSTNPDDLADQIDSLQRAFANERGEWERFRQEIRTNVRILLQRGSY